MSIFVTLLLLPVFCSRFSMSNRTLSGQDALNNFISTLYNQLFAAIVMLLNRALGGTNHPAPTSIAIVDFPGSNFNSVWAEVSIDLFIYLRKKIGFIY